MIIMCAWWHRVFKRNALTFTSGWWKFFTLFQRRIDNIIGHFNLKAIITSFTRRPDDDFTLSAMQ